MKKEINSFLESLKISDEKNLDRTELQNQQEFLHKTVSSYLDTYQDKNSVEAKEYMCYLAAAIYLSYKKLYPNLVVRIPFRTKSDISYIKNIQKEFEKSLANVSKNINLDEPITLETLQKYFSTDPTTKDIQAATIVLDHFKEPVLLTYEPGKYDDPNNANLPNKNDPDFCESIDSLVEKDKKYTEFITVSKPKINEFISEKTNFTRNN